VPRWVAGSLAAQIAALALLHAFALGTFRVEGSSMESTLAPGDLLLVSKLDVTGARIRALLGSSDSCALRRGELVVFRLPENPSLILVKRVFAAPRDRAVIDGFDAVVPPGALFVIGDNRAPNASVDSRAWGYLPCANVIGRVVARLLPSERAARFPAAPAP
jgi:signal peptidase I